MKIAKMILSPEAALENAAKWEGEGFDAILTNESKHDPFVLGSIAALQTSKAEIMSYITVAFARTPMLCAHSANDLNQLSKGRFTLGLGSQIKPHIERRYNMPWSNPAPRMKEYIQAMHAIWDSWYEGKKLDFKGEFYSHTLMTPEFTPPELDIGRPKVHLGAVGPYMTKVAGEVADGLITHSFTTPSYMKNVTLPTIDAAVAGRAMDRKDFQVTTVPFVATGETEESLKEAIHFWRRKVAFYCSTPAYRPVLEHHGWGELNDILHPMSREGKWEEMRDVIDDEVLHTFVTVGTSKEIVPELRKRFGDLCDRISVRFGDDISTERLAEAIKELQAA